MLMRRCRIDGKPVPSLHETQVMMKLQLPEGLEDEMQLMLLDKASHISETRSDLKNPGVEKTQIPVTGKKHKGHVNQ